MADFKYDRRETGNTKVVDLRDMDAEARKKRIEEVKAKGWKFQFVDDGFAYFKKKK